MTKLIGLTGRAQHGKDTAAALLVEEYGFMKVAFADALRRAAEILNPVVDWETPGRARRYTAALEDLGYEDAKKLPEVRRTLQVLGTEVGREIFGQDCWVQALALKLRESEGPWVISDVRFPNEAAFVRQSGGKVIRVKRINEDGSPFDNGIGRDHPSEMYVDNLPVDYEFEVPDIASLQASMRVIADYETKGTPYVSQA